jgi:predicted transcriptional regulator
MTKSELIKLAGTQNKLASILGITQSAIAQWRDVPKSRQWQLLVLKPEWFKKN